MFDSRHSLTFGLRALTRNGVRTRSPAANVTSPRMFRDADRPEARLTLGSSYARRRDAAKAEAEHKAALKLAPQFAPAAVNLADLHRQTGRDAEGEAALRAALALSPKGAGLHHALGLALIRLKRSGEAIGGLRQVAELAPESAQNAYVYASRSIRPTIPARR